MPWYKSVSRRYSPPTCTLEISLKHSLWSLCTGQCPRKQIQFQLIFDAPQSSTEQPLVVISGDAFALEELYQVLKQYTEQFFDRDRRQTNRAEFLLDDSLELSSHSGSQVLPPPSPDRDIRPDSTFNQNLSIHIQPHRSLTHELHLGFLATEESSPMIQLGNLQLLDLVTALEECIVDLTAIGWWTQVSWKTMSWSVAKWTISAIALLTLGFTAFAASRGDRQPSPPPLSQPTLRSIPHSQSK